MEEQSGQRCQLTRASGGLFVRLAVRLLAFDEAAQGLCNVDVLAVDHPLRHAGHQIENVVQRVQTVLFIEAIGAHLLDAPVNGRIGHRLKHHLEYVNQHGHGDRS